MLQLLQKLQHHCSALTADGRTYRVESSQGKLNTELQIENIS